VCLHGRRRSLRSNPALLGSPLLVQAARPMTVASTREIFETHAPFVVRIVRRLGVRPSDVEDVAQEVFVIVHRRRADLQAGVSVRSWLFGITRRVVANYHRQARHRHEESSSGLDSVPVHSDPTQAIEGSRERVLLDRALAKLDTDKRAVFVLFELECLDMREVAQMVGCPLNTAYSRLYAARTLVRTYVLRASNVGGRHER
jgi:RNA polymerase sigma-70 factor (ECF subfamily)